MLRLAVRLAHGSHPQQRLRLVLLAVVAVITTVTALFTAGVLHALSGESHRFQDRVVTLAQDDERVTVRVDERTDTWDQRQYPVVWLDPANQDDPAAMPPGMEAWPEPGGWVVSPGLAALAQDHPDLAARFPGADVLTDEGVLHPGELLAYRHMPDNGVMGVAAVDATGFGGPGRGRAIGDDTELDLPAMTLALAGFVALPLVLLAAAGTAVSAPLRAQRLALLHAIGVPAKQRRRLVVQEAATVFLPGIALGTLVWTLCAPWIHTIPVVERPVADDALTLPVWATAAVAVCLAVLFAALSTVTEHRRRDTRHRATPRPRAGRPRLPALRTAPALAAVALLVAAMFRDGDSAAMTTLAGVVLLAVGTPLALPVIARAAGNRMAGRASAPEHVLAGRRLQYDPRSAVRPLYGIAALLVITPVVAAWIAAARDLDPPAPPDAAVEAVWLRGALDHMDTEILLRDLPDAVVAPLAPGRHDPSQPPALHIGLTCADAGRLLKITACDDQAAPTPEATQRLSTVLNTSMDIKLISPDLGRLTAEDQVAVLAPRDARLETTIRAAALAHPAALNVLSAADLELQESELVSWIFGGIAVLGSLAFLVLATGMIDRTAAGRRESRLLGALGLTLRRIRGISTQEFLLGYATVVGTGMAAGIIASTAWSNLDPAISYPVGPLVLTLAVATALAGFGILGVRIMTKDTGPNP
ncbi:FtsX-like permease family protein [Streptomyces aidingensis]|uniref:FtsX-like permease family protein n=2 Tax=Streptomyces aidingensis TaxID=910347 RepID=A0A1I1TWX9_9ACTN|nr:FtsX-like permease family protein [Streptomyces aidingensis]